MNKRQVGWMSFLAGFDFDLDDIPGTKNVMVDALSRLPHPDGPHDQGVSSVTLVLESTCLWRLEC